MDAKLISAKHTQTCVALSHLEVGCSILPCGTNAKGIRMAETLCEGGRLYYDCPARSCFKVNANAIVRNNEGKLLLIRVGKGYYEGYWSLPGGRVDGGESLLQTAEREVKEEAGIRVKAEKLVCLGELIDNPWHMFVAIISAKPLEERLKAGAEESGVAWFSEEEAMEVLLPFGRKALECEKSGTRLFRVTKEYKLPVKKQG